MSNRNDVLAGTPPSPFKGDEWATFDRLPPEIRREMFDGGDWCALSVANVRRQLKSHRQTKHDADSYLILVLRGWAADERQEFADQFEQQYGGEYPARAAQSTAMRYNERERLARRGRVRRFR